LSFNKSIGNFRLKSQVKGNRQKKHPFPRRSFGKNRLKECFAGHQGINLLRPYAKFKDFLDAEIGSPEVDGGYHGSQGEETHREDG